MFNSNKMKILYFVLFAVLSITNARAELRAGDLVAMCEGREPILDRPEIGLFGCANYISGVVDGIRIGEYKAENISLCLPEIGLTNEQLIKIFLKWAEETPEELHETARSRLYLTLTDLFPCN